MATAPQTTNTTTLSGLPVEQQPGAQLPYGPGASTPYAGQTGSMPSQTGAVPGSVMTAGPVATNAPTSVVKGSLDQIQAGAAPMQNANQQVQESIASFEDTGSQYMQNAIRRGLETAAARGLGNSSIAAGASQRAALESIQPFVAESLDTQRQRETQQFQSQQNQLNQALDLQKQRENLAFQGEQAQIDRDLKTKLQQDSVYQQDWLNNQNFTREFNAALSQLPIKNAFEMQNLVAQYALENPEVYTPNVVTGMTNFLQNNMMSILQQYFPNLVTVK